VFVGDGISEEKTEGGPRDSLTVREPGSALLPTPDAPRFNWRDFGPFRERLRAYFDLTQQGDDGERKAAKVGLWAAEPTATDILAIVGLRFEARILASRAIRAVFLGADAQSLSAKIIAANRGVVSFGICGGLAPDLRAGACVIASHVHDGKRIWHADAAWSRRLAEAIPDAIIAPILGVDAPVADAAAKGRLYERFGAAVVDMESHLAAAIASAHRLPFAAIRVVADDARCELPDAALAGRRVDGSIDATAVLRALLNNPADLARLIRLAAQTRLARAKLLRLSQCLGGRMGLPVARLASAATLTPPHALGE
jgi:hopanoid-associated phosphorylase